MGSTRSRARQVRGLHLLLVDDSAPDRHLVEVMLRGVRGDQDRLTTVSTVAAACHALTEHGDIDLVLLDLRLPDSQGIATVRRILDVTRGVPIIVLTETDDEAVGLDCVAAGAQDYLPKSELRALLLGRVIEYAVMRSRDSSARQRLEQEVLESSEHERQRIARDLHDDLGQQLTGISIMARALATKLGARELPEAGEARELAELVQGAIAQSLALARGLDPLTEYAELPIEFSARTRNQYVVPAVSFVARYVVTLAPTVARFDQLPGAPPASDAR